MVPAEDALINRLLCFNQLPIGPIFFRYLLLSTPIEIFYFKVKSSEDHRFMCGFLCQVTSCTDAIHTHTHTP